MRKFLRKILNIITWPSRAIVKWIFYPTPRGKVRWAVLGIFILAILAGFLDYPLYYNKTADWLNGQLDRVKYLEKINLPHYYSLPFHLGLDLLGGTHLVYEADLKDIEGGGEKDAMAGVRDVIERRVNIFGVSEPVVQTTSAGDKWRVIVELAGVKDVSEAIKMIGETPILEFKEENNDPPRELTEEEKKQLADNNRAAEIRASEAAKEIIKGEKDFVDFIKELSEDEATKERGGDLGYLTPGGQDDELYQEARKIGLGRISPKPIKTSAGYNIIRVDNQRVDQEVKANHILICYQGATRCDKQTSKEEARVKIEELKKQTTPENFAALAKEHSTEPGAEQSGGDLGWFKRGDMVSSFENAAFALAKGGISDVVETEFGFHLVYKTDERSSIAYQVRRILFKTRTEDDIRGPKEPWKNTGLSGKQLKRAQVQFDPNTNDPQVGLEFDSEGKKLFGEITERNVEKLVAIFLDGYPITVPRVNEPIREGRAVITGSFTITEAKQLVQRLNAGALPVPVKLISQQTVGASLGKESINKSLQASFIGLVAVVLFMLIYYRLPGLLAAITLSIYAVLVLAVFKLWPVTLTLSGVAGFILSIGMAVDANVLIFERLKEELRLGKTMGTAIDDGFKRAWTSIRDSNFSTLITCSILATFSTSVVKGFAITLSLGVVISMFSAITITRVFLKLVAAWTENRWWYGVRKQNYASNNSKT